MLTEKEYWAETFTDLALSEQRISSIEFDDCIFKGCDLRETVFSHCRFIDCHFIDCDMNVVKFIGSRFEVTYFKSCKLTGVDWTTVDYSEFLEEAPFSFYDSILDYSSFFGEKLQTMVMQNCKAVEVDFREADLKGADFSRSDLSASLFRNTVLVKSDFTGAQDYTIDIRINNISGAKFSASEAVCLLESLDIELI
ncbi:MAG: pentapeptide repeat-containing protein [Sulfurimonadaceae bacterium]